MSRERDEEVLARLPDGMIDQIHLKADAGRLIAAVFGEEGYPRELRHSEIWPGDGFSVFHAVRVGNIRFVFSPPFGAKNCGERIRGWT